MAAIGINTVDETGFARGLTAGVDAPPASAGAVSWGAIFAGAAAAAALSLILLLLGTGMGLSSVSPWSQSGVSATTFGVSTIIWIMFTQVAASAAGGYIAGRLRSRWIGIHRDEAYFRDTAHGFLAWAVSTLATAALLASATTSVINAGVQAGASVVGGASTAMATVAAGGAAVAGSEMAKSDPGGGPMSYLMDSLFRKGPTPNTGTAGIASTAGSAASPDSANISSTAAPTTEVARIFLNTIRTGALPPNDLKYVGQLVAQRTGLEPLEAEKRVIDTYAQAQAKIREVEIATKEAADKARKASAAAALWLVASLLIGAFVASIAATYGGKQRDF